jgi:hypothetical protein
VEFAHFSFRTQTFITILVMLHQTDQLHDQLIQPVYFYRNTMYEGFEAGPDITDKTKFVPGKKKFKCESLVY